MPASKELKDFIANLHKNKLCGWSDEQYTILTDRKLGYRLDHQGVSSHFSHSNRRLRHSLECKQMNKDPSTKPHRIYIQPVAGGKSRDSKLDPRTVLANVHCDDPEDEERMREALLESANGDGTLVVVHTMKPQNTDSKSPDSKSPDSKSSASKSSASKSSASKSSASGHKR